MRARHSDDRPVYREIQYKFLDTLAVSYILLRQEREGVMDVWNEEAFRVARFVKALNTERRLDPAVVRIGQMTSVASRSGTKKR